MIIPLLVFQVLLHPLQPIRIPYISGNTAVSITGSASIAELTTIHGLLVELSLPPLLQIQPAIWQPTLVPIAHWQNVTVSDAATIAQLTTINMTTATAVSLTALEDTANNLTITLVPTLLLAKCHRL